MANNNREQLSAEAQLKFSEGITLILQKWDALNAAVENRWGGPNSRQLADQIHSDIFNWFTQPNESHYIDELEDMLYQSLLTLNTELDDGSDEQVAADLANIYEECLAGNYATIEVLGQTSTAPRPSARQVIDDEDDDDDDGSMQIDDSSNMMGNAPRPQSNSNSNSAIMPAVEPEDGWVVVSSRRRRN